MRKLALAVLALLAFGDAAIAQNYPSRPITIIVPFSAGGPSDVMARILADRMKTTLGETVLVENVTGAGGSIGVGRALRSPADGYTISFGHLGTHVANGAIYKLGYDLLADLEPVVLLPSNPMVFVSKNAVPAKSLKELIDWLKARPAPATAGTAGAGSGSHIAGLYFENITGIKLQYVPYRGTGPAMNDLVAGRSTSSLISYPIPSRRCGPETSGPMPSPIQNGRSRPPIFQPPMRRACLDFS